MESRDRICLRTRPPHVTHTREHYQSMSCLRDALKEESLPKVIEEEAAEQGSALLSSFEESGLHLP